jgi:predicted transcriptional regulator
MSAPLITIPPDMNIKEAARLMFEKKIKKLLMIDNNRLVGLVGLTAIDRALPSIANLLQKLAALHDAPKSIKKL